MAGWIRNELTVRGDRKDIALFQVAVRNQEIPLCAPRAPDEYRLDYAFHTQAAPPVAWLGLMAAEFPELHFVMASHVPMHSIRVFVAHGGAVISDVSREIHDITPLDLIAW